MRRALAGLAFALTAAWAGMAGGHPMPSTTVLVSAVPAGFEAEVSIPLSELDAAIGKPLREADEAALRNYILAHVAVVELNERPWPSRIDRLTFDNLERPTLEVTLSFTAPPGANRRWMLLRYDAVTHEVASHNVLVYFRPAAGADPKPLGRLQAPARLLPLSLP